MTEKNYSDGHEVEGVNFFKLAKALLIGATVAGGAAVFVVQLSYQQRNSLREEAAESGSYRLDAHKKRVRKELKGIDAVAASFVAKPEMLKAAAEPQGFMHPDKVKGVGHYAPGATPPPKAKVAPFGVDDGGDIRAAAETGDTAETEKSGEMSKAVDAPDKNAKPTPAIGPKREGNALEKGRSGEQAAAKKPQVPPHKSTPSSADTSGVGDK